MRLINPQYHSSLPRNFEGKVYVEFWFDRVKNRKAHSKVLHLTSDQLDDLMAARKGTWKHWSEEVADDEPSTDTTSGIAQELAQDQHVPTAKEARQLMKLFNKEFAVGTKFTVRVGENKTKDMWSCSCAFMKKGQYALVFLSASPTHRKENMCIPVHWLIRAVVEEVNT